MPASANSAKAKRRIVVAAMRGASCAPQCAANSTGGVQYKATSIIGQWSSPRALCQLMRTRVLSTKMVSRVERMLVRLQG